jgi:hypothetical protein
MNRILLILYSILLLPLYESHIKPKLCVNCKFFKTDFISNKYGKCSFFVTQKEDEYFLVNGVDNSKKDYAFCSIARKYEDMCGKDGKFYEKKTRRVIL